MARKEILYLSGATVEIEFLGEDLPPDDYANFRPRLKESLMKCLVADGVAFEDREKACDWKANGEASTRLESVIDSWIRTGKYKWTKAKDKHSKKVRWMLDCEEPVTILAEPE